jgi:hypothetical protein
MASQVAVKHERARVAQLGAVASALDSCIRMELEHLKKQLEAHIC